MATSLKEIGDAFVAAVQDVVTLEVLTFTGSLTGKLKDGKIDWSLVKLDAADNTLQLVAATRIDADMDVVNFRATGSAELTPALVQLHEAAVKCSIDARTAFLRMVLAPILG